MKYNRQDPNPSTKFYFDDDDTSQGYVLLRNIPFGVLEQFRKECSKKQPAEYRKGTRYDVPPKVDDRLMSELMWDYIITGWEGIVDEKDKPIPCTKENKIDLMRNWVWFSVFISSSLEKLTDMPEQAAQDEQIKNFLNSQSG